MHHILLYMPHCLCHLWAHHWLGLGRIVMEILDVEARLELSRLKRRIDTL